MLKDSAHREALQNELARSRSLVLDVKVIPRAPTLEVSGWMADGALKVKVTAAPEKGKANEEVCAVLAAYLNVHRRTVEVILGHTSQRKRVRISVSG
jgi:hypothetical protein